MLPRSLPRKIAMEWPQVDLEYFSHDQCAYFRRIRLRNFLLEHEGYRRQQWFRLKYSRRKDHLWFEQSRSVKSEEEIRSMQLQSDLHLHEYLRKYLTGCEFEGDKLRRMVLGLGVLCERETHFEETR